MGFPTYKELEKLETIVEIEQEIFMVTKSLFDLRIQRATTQNVKPHVFTHTKRRLAQLQFKKGMFLKTLEQNKK